MWLMEITVVVCNVCGDKNAPTRRWLLSQPEHKVNELAVDLCEAHEAPLLAILGESATPALPTPQRPPSAARRARKSGGVTSMAEIEKLKHQ